MEGLSSRSGSDSIMSSKKGNRVASKSLVRGRDQTLQCCYRRGCCGRVKYSQNAKTESEVTGNSSTSSSATIITGTKRSYIDGESKLTSHPKDDSSESSPSVDSAASDAPSSSSSGYQSKKKSVRTTVKEGKGKPLGSVSGNSGIRSSMPCNSTPDDLPSTSSSSDTKSAATNVRRKRSQEEETNGISHRVERKKSLASSPVVKSHATDSRQSSSVSGEICNRRANSTKNKGTVRESSVRKPPFIAGGRCSLGPFPSNLSSTGSRSRNLSSAARDRPFERKPRASPSGHGWSQSRDFSARHNRSDSDEVLLALELLEQNVELTPEQVRLLERSSIPTSFTNSYDRHQEMRLDIDNMSYEELLALGERMGTVSTALSEEEMSKCLEKGTYKQTPSDGRLAGEDGANCSICQDEYEVGDETGTLIECKHGFHMSCIARWFQDKNWCPICKASAVEQSPPSSL